MNPYQTRTTEGLSGVELTIVLYDGIIRFLYGAIQAVEAGDERGRRTAVKRALDILIYLQATLRADVGGKPAEVLAEFYAAMFALILQGSQRASSEKFLKVIQFVKNVRDAWRQVVTDPPVAESLPSAAITSAGVSLDASRPLAMEGDSGGWLA